jgi:hypothetical protein
LPIRTTAKAIKSRSPKVGGPTGFRPPKRIRSTAAAIRGAATYAAHRIVHRGRATNAATAAVTIATSRM